MTVKQKIKVAVMGCGNIGQYALSAVNIAEDMTLVGVVEQENCLTNLKRTHPDLPVVCDINQLPQKPDVAVLGIPSREVTNIAPRLLAQGINTVDCFDMHGEFFIKLKNALEPIARTNNVAAIMGCGVDPGVSTMIRAIFELWAATGISYVTYGPGMSMGHTVAAKSYPGVRDALAITRPGEPGRHKREIYLELEPGASFKKIKRMIMDDPYFSHDDVRFIEVDKVAPLVDRGHRIHISRKGGASGVDNQQLEFETTFHNPASTAQVLVNAARAVTTMSPGAYTMLEVPLISFLNEDTESLLRRVF
ncbi:MAG: diaminopimelate dehydrogenase [Anaerolineaceae bacterium]|jgi:diaminopimelate dehydrogenase|nr:diaminopimelate dehydrogenase [Anaerolineaceae bacterium]